MKIFLALLSALTVCCQGQTFVNVKLPAFAWSGGPYVSSVSFSVPTNTLARIVNLLTTPDITGGEISVQYSGRPAYPIDLATLEFLNVPMLGPATNTVTIWANGSGASCTFLVQYDTVNGTGSPSGVIQPAGFSTSVALQTSTNMTSWSTLTNASFGPTNRARFFRLSQTIP